jgi:hypothetical protein
LDLEAHYRGSRYVIEIKEMLLQKPDSNFIAQLFHKMAALGRIYPAKTPIPSG